MQILFIALGVYMLAMAVGFLAGKTALVRPKFREHPDLRRYMRLCGVVYAVTGVLGLILAFLPEGASEAHPAAVKALPILLLVCVAALIVLNHLFVSGALSQKKNK
jgi:O-antigen/teichoic acid export membrane protein